MEFRRYSCEAKDATDSGVCTWQHFRLYLEFLYLRRHDHHVLISELFDDHKLLSSLPCILLSDNHYPREPLEAKGKRY